jgi:hypothetical protein
MQVGGVINRYCPPARSIWLAWERARRRAACRAIRTGDTRQLEWLERAKEELQTTVVN